MDEKNEMKNVEITREQIEKLETFYFELSCELRKFSFRPRFSFYSTAEKINVIRTYICALEILEIRVPETDPLIADLLKSDLLPGRGFWAPVGDRPEK